MQARRLVPALLFLVVVISVCAQGQGPLVFSGPTIVPQSPPNSNSSDASALDPNKTASISGTVFSATTGAPLRKAEVTVRGGEEKVPSRAATTDQNGHFSIEGILPGEYNIVVQHTDYVLQRYGQDKPGKPSVMLTLSAGQKIDDLAFHLQQAAVITGHVYDETNDPIEGANVEVMRFIYVRGKHQLVDGQEASTNDQGEYRIYGLEPGRYFVRATHSGNAFMNLVAEGQVLYPPVFYSNGDSPDRATPLDLKPGDEIPAIDLQLIPIATQGHEVSGKIIGGDAISITMVMMLEKTADSDIAGLGLNARQVTTNRADGTFRFVNVTPGTYRLRAVENENGQVKVATGDLVVGSTNVSNVTLALTLGVDISGHITFEGKIDQTGEAGVNLMPASSEDAFGGSASSPIQPDGSFTLKNVTDGTYKLQVWSMCETCYLKSASSRGTDLLGTSFDVRGGVAPQSIDVVYSANSAEASGTVNGDDEKPVAGAMVMAVPVAETPNRESRYKTSTTDQNGHFDLRGLAPGNYDVIALSGLDDDGQNYTDPDFLQPYADKAQSLIVAANDRKTLQLTAVAASSDSQ
jgi:protocatechuate 3,4-dioxygenase beta subunit